MKAIESTTPPVPAASPKIIERVPTDTAGVSAEINAGGNRSIDDIIKLTEFEIKRMDDSKKEDGWTPWVLYVALAAIAWKLIEAASLPNNWPKIVLTWSLLVISWTYLSSFSSYINSIRVPRAFRTRGIFSANALLAKSRTYLLFIAAKAAAAYVVFLSFGGLTGVFKVYWAIINGSVVLISFAVLLLSFFDFPLYLGAGKSKNWKKWAGPLGALFFIGSLGIFGHRLWQLWTELPVLPVLPTAMMCFAVTEIVALILSFQVRNPTRDSLVALRRSIGLGSVSVEQAKGQLEIALFGHEASGYLQMQATELLMHLARLNHEQDAANKTMAIIEAHYEKGCVGDNLTIINALMDTVVNHVERTHKIGTEIKKSSTQFQRKALALSAISEQTESNIANLRRQIESQIDAYLTKAELTREATKSIRARIAKTKEENSAETSAGSPGL